jgi:hypothetical protein
MEGVCSRVDDGHHTAVHDPVWNINTVYDTGQKARLPPSYGSEGQGPDNASTTAAKCVSSAMSGCSSGPELRGWTFRASGSHLRRHRTNVCQPGGGDLTRELHDGDQRPLHSTATPERPMYRSEILEQRVMDLLTLGELVP